MKVIDKISEHPDDLSVTLGITYHSTDDPNTLEARLTCQKHISQPWGFMSGGATLALAENLAGVASMSLTPEKIVFGINIAANHMSSVRIGETVIATARLLRMGGRLHHWMVEVVKEDGTKVSEIMVTNYTK